MGTTSSTVAKDADIIRISKENEETIIQISSNECFIEIHSLELILKIDPKLKNFFNGEELVYNTLNGNSSIKLLPDDRIMQVIDCDATSTGTTTKIIQAIPFPKACQAILKSASDFESEP
jgi:hypothetical protein